MKINLPFPIFLVLLVLFWRFSLILWTIFHIYFFIYDTISSKQFIGKWLSTHRTRSATTKERIVLHNIIQRRRFRAFDAGRSDIKQNNNRGFDYFTLHCQKRRFVNRIGNTDNLFFLICDSMKKGSSTFRNNSISCIPLTTAGRCDLIVKKYPKCFVLADRVNPLIWLLWSLRLLAT